MLWEEQLLEMDQREEGKSERSSEGAQKVAGTIDGDDVSFQLTLTQTQGGGPQPVESQSSQTYFGKIKYNEELLRHQINNKFWYYPRRHGSGQETVGDVFTFDEASVTFKVSNHNRIFVL